MPILLSISRPFWAPNIFKWAHGATHVPLQHILQQARGVVRRNLAARIENLLEEV